MKGMIIFGIIVVVIGGYFIIGSDKISEIVEKYSVEKIKDPDLEKLSYYNIRYMDFTGKYDRCLELIDKYSQRYEDDGKFIPEILLTQARILELKMQVSKARATYQKYSEKFPNGADIEEVKSKLLELKN
jgi:hypothetical protein